MKKIVKRVLGKGGILFFRKVKYGFLNFICSLFPMKKEILFESHPDLSCNSFELYRYLLRKKINDDFHLVWMVNNPKDYENFKIKNVEFIDIHPKGFINKFSFYKRCNRAEIIITCNRHIAKYKTSKKQINVYIEHGSPIKYARPDIEGLSCGFFISQASFFAPYLIDELSLKHDQIINTGFPRNDQLFRNNNSIDAIIKNAKSFDKIIIWVPTFRKKIITGRVDSSFEMPMGIPIIYDVATLSKFNTLLKKHNVLLIVKPHPAQDMSRFLNKYYSNIQLLTNELLREHDIQTNELLQQTDAMITDYSGIYFDYLLLDKPIGITVDDFKEYRDNTGFVFNDPFEVLKGHIIKEYGDLTAFIENVCRGVDPSLEERKAIKRLTNEYVDGNASERVWDFINKKYNEIYKNR